MGPLRVENALGLPGDHLKHQRLLIREVVIELRFAHAACRHHIVPGSRGAWDGARSFRLAICRGRAFGPAGRLPEIKAVKYGTDAYDQWSVDELLTLANGAAASAR